MRIQAKSLGNAKGYVLAQKGRVPITPRTSIELERTPLELAADSGKFGDSEDSFVYLYTKVDPACCNFELRARIWAHTTAGCADQQCGYGMLLADTDASEDTWCRHRNHMLVGCFGAEHRFGARMVAGYTSPKAREFESVRIYDSRRVFSVSPDGSLNGKPHLFCVKKDDDGIEASIDGEVLSIPGCDFLMQQDKKWLNVGFAVARGVAIRICDVVFSTSPGSMSHTPEGELVHVEPSTPFPASILDASEECTRIKDTTVYVSPDAQADGVGTTASPLTLAAALCRVGAGSTIVLEPGTYMLSVPLIVGRVQSGEPRRPICLKARHPRQSVFDGTKLDGGLPLLALGADYWCISGIVFANGPSSGLVVSGSANRIENCEAYDNGDTGIVICAPSGLPRISWPAGNYVVDCDSHGNRDVFGVNADGFGAKLRVGRGNVFYRCIAHHNVDDGFDCYAKSVIGPTDAVELDSCVAYSNGSVGFKLGGENQPVEHEAWNCLAVGNKRAGFSSNSNPSCSVHFCTALGNGRRGAGNFQMYSADVGHHVRRCVRESRFLPAGGADAAIARQPDGSIEVAGCKTVTRRGHSRKGADFKPKNVLIMTESIGGGGAQRVACRLATQLSGDMRTILMFFMTRPVVYPVGPRVQLIDATNGWNEKTADARNTLPWKIARLLELSRYVLRARKEYDIDVSISFLRMPNLLNLLFGAQRRILSERNDPTQQPFRFYYERAKLACGLADFVVFQSRKVTGMFGPRTRAKSCIIANPVSVDVRALPNRAPKIVNVGRLVGQKNQALLIRAFAQFHKTHPEHHLHIYGEGALRGDLEALVHQLGASRFVHFEGFCGDVLERIADAEQFVLSSDFEGLSNALLEAMLMGVASISTACTGSDELVHDGVDGLLVPVGDADALCAAMCRLADDPQLRERIEHNAVSRAFEFSPENIARKWRRIF